MKWIAHCGFDCLIFIGENISTPLYPHQRKALSFLLEREQELVGPAGKAVSLWQCNGSSWQNSVTSDLVYTKPEECKGALLADDMGLGKTLVSAINNNKSDGLLIRCRKPFVF